MVSLSTTRFPTTLTLAISRPSTSAVSGVVAGGGTGGVTMVGVVGGAAGVVAGAVFGVVAGGVLSGFTGTDSAGGFSLGVAAGWWVSVWFCARRPPFQPISMTLAPPCAAAGTVLAWASKRPAASPSKPVARRASAV